MNPKETILSIAKENWVLRMLCLFLGIGMMTCGAATYFLSKKPALVWMVTYEGKITNSKGHFFDWEVEEAIQRAVDLFYVANPNRGELIPFYFSPELAESARKFEPRDRLAVFKINKLENTNNGIEAQGILRRSNDADEKLLLKLNKVERTETNPFGLIISHSEKFEEKEEKKSDGLGQDKK